MKHIPQSDRDLLSLWDLADRHTNERERQQVARAARLAAEKAAKRLKQQKGRN